MLVFDSRTAESFELAVTSDNALDVFAIRSRTQPSVESNTAQLATTDQR